MDCPRHFNGVLLWCNTQIVNVPLSSVRPAGRFQKEYAHTDDQNTWLMGNGRQKHDSGSFFVMTAAV